MFICRQSEESTISMDACVFVPPFVCRCLNLPHAIAHDILLCFWTVFLLGKCSYSILQKTRTRSTFIFRVDPQIKHRDYLYLLILVRLPFSKEQIKYIKLLWLLFHNLTLK